MKRLAARAGKILGCALLAVMVFITSAGSAPMATTAAAGITLSSSVQISFPSSILFKIKAQDDVNIVDIRLHYIVARQNFASVVSEGWPQFTPATSVDTQWLWDMRKSSLPPGAQVEYWWTADDAAGKSSETDHATVTFEDSRYNWQSITTNPVTILWYDGSRTFANSLMTAAQQGLQRIENDTGAVPKGNVRIYIYASTQDLQGAQLFTPQWEGGVTFEGYDIIAIGVATNNLAFGQRAVPTS